MSSGATSGELFPELRADDLERGWGESLMENQRAGSGADPDADMDDDERLLREVPPHHGD